MGGLAAKKQANAQARIALGNASIAERNAIIAGHAGAVNASRVGRQGQRSVSKIRTGAAKSGVEVDTGTPLDVQVADVVNSAVNEMYEIYKADRQAEGFEHQAHSFKSQASAYRAAGKNAMMAGFINAAATVAAGTFIGYQGGVFGPTSAGLKANSAMYQPPGSPLIWAS